MGKDVTWRHLQVFVLGSAVIGLAGAMLTTLDGIFTPTNFLHGAFSEPSRLRTNSRRLQFAKT